jgi:putative DNA primase/helicase
MMFVDFARAHGVLIDHLVEDGRIHRCATEGHERKKNGAWMYDGRRGWVMAWDIDGEVHWFNDPHAPAWTDAEKRAVDERRRAQAKRDQWKRLAAVKEATAMLRRASWAPAAYMQYKGFREKLSHYAKPEWKHGYAHVVDGAMFVPMYSLQGQIVGGQVIRWLPDEQRHEKKMIPGTKAKGAVFRLGPAMPRVTWLCEGFATGLSIKMALEQMRFADAVLVCFSDSNLVHVAPQIPGMRFVFADNDQSGAGERAAIATGLPYAMSSTEGFDANDVHVKNGLFAVCELIRKARRSEP